MGRGLSKVLFLNHLYDLYKEAEDQRRHAALEKANRIAKEKAKAAAEAEEEQRRLDEERDRKEAEANERALQRKVEETKAALDRKIAYLRKYGAD